MSSNRESKKVFSDCHERLTFGVAVKCRRLLASHPAQPGLHTVAGGGPTLCCTPQMIWKYQAKGSKLWSDNLFLSRFRWEFGFVYFVFIRNHPILQIYLVSGPKTTFFSVKRWCQVGKYTGNWIAIQNNLYKIFTKLIDACDRDVNIP